MSIRDVEQRADWLAGYLQDDRYRISRTWLSKVERGQVAPQLHKLCALLVVYRLPLSTLPHLCGIEESRIIQYQLQTPLPTTCPFAIYIDGQEQGGQRMLRLPQVNPDFDGAESLTEDHIIIGQGVAPLAETQPSDKQDYLYAFIGSEDQRMAPLVPVGSLLQIDTQQRQILSGAGPDELRPLYLVKIRNQYLSGWLELHGRRTTLLAHSLSGSHSLAITGSSEVEIIGRATGIVMSFESKNDIERPPAFNINYSRNAEAAPAIEPREQRLRPLLNIDFLAREIAAWGVGPLVLWQHVDHKRLHIGYVGRRDWMAFPRLLPGAWLRIDERHKQIEEGPWPNNYLRPFYFVKVPEGYTCCWVERDGDDLVLIPYPGSPCGCRRLRYGKDAQIVGRVTGAATRLGSDLNGGSAFSPDLRGPVVGTNGRTG